MCQILLAYSIHLHTTCSTCMCDEVFLSRHSAELFAQLRDLEQRHDHQPTKVEHLPGLHHVYIETSCEQLHFISEYFRFLHHVLQGSSIVAIWIYLTCHFGSTIFLKDLASEIHNQLYNHLGSSKERCETACVIGGLAARWGSSGM